MAIYHFNSQVFTRSKGHSAVGKAAYRAAEKLHDERLEKTFDYSKKGDCFYREIMLAKDAPKRMGDREKLWNEVEAVEKRKDAQLSREIQFSLPKELTEEQNIKLTKEYVQDQFVAKGMVADVCFHKGHGKDQPHVHVMLTTREVTKDGFGQKVREWNNKALLYEQREEWANYTNKHLALAGLDIKIDHRSNKELGIELEPQNKIGPNDGRERYSEKVAEHDEIARRNGEKIYDNPNIAIDALTKYRSSFDNNEIAKFINRHTVDEEQFTRVYEKVKASPELTYIGKDTRDNDRYSSKEMVELEYRMVRQAQALDEKATHPVDLGEREDVAKGYGLSENQIESFRHITGDRDIACIVGYAGSGKSYALGAAREVWEKAGYNVVGMTLSGIAAENLEGGSGIKSYTVANRIINWDNDREKLQKKDIVVIDEAGMLGSRDIARIMDEATGAGAKIVMVGDPKQLQSIEAGAAFRGVIERVGFSEMNEVRRQKETWQQEATKSLAIGEIGDAIKAYHKEEMVHEFDDTGSAKEKMVNDWHECSLQQKSSIMLAYTKKEVSDLNLRAREVRKSYDELGIEATYNTERGKRDFAINDRIYFLKNDKELGVKNGTLGTISSLSSHTFEVELDKGGAVKFDIRDYKDIDHGYTATIHKSQGVTVDKSFLLASKYIDKHATYVGMSRHRESAELYWSKDQFRNMKELEYRLGRDNRKDLTLDYSIDDYKDNTAVFSQNKDVELDKGFSLEKKYEDLDMYSKNAKLSKFFNDVEKEFQYSYVGGEVKNRENGEYLGDVKVGDKNISIVEQRGIVGYLLDNADTKKVSIGDAVEVLHEIKGDGEKVTKLIREDEAETIENRYEKQKANQYIGSLARKLQSKENYRIDNKVSTKDMYKALYNRLPSILPEFGFIKKGNSYVSSTGQKVDGSYGQKGKVYVYENNPGVLVDYTRQSKSIWDYASETAGLKDKKEIFQYLSSAAGISSYFDDKLVELRNKKVVPTDIPEIKQEQKISSDIWQKLYQHCLDKMEVPNNQVEKYLKDERGLNSEEIKNTGIGYLPNKKQLLESLQNQGMPKEKAEELLKTLGCIGYTHKMIMPYYDKTGNIMGVAARNIKYDEQSKFGKYIYSKGLARSSTMLGIENIDVTKPVTMVEGMLDTLRAKAVGIDNVVAIGGTGVNIRQMELIKELGIKKINLCLDNDNAGIEATKHIANMLLDNNSDIKISEIKLPSDIKDLDQLIQEKGTEAAKDVIVGAQKINQYELQEAKELQVLDKFAKEKDGYEYELEYRG